MNAAATQPDAAILSLASWDALWRGLDRARRRGDVEAEVAIAGDIIRLNAVWRRRGCASIQADNSRAGGNRGQ